MDQILINQVAVGIFLAITLLVGLRTKRANTIEEYTTTGQSLSSGVLMISLIATLISANGIWISAGFAKGYIIFTHPVSMSIMMILFGWTVYPKLMHFENATTLSHVITTMYGEMAGVVASVIGIIASILVVVAQLKFVTKLSTLIGIEPSTIVLLFGGLVTLYTCLGGLKSVVMTDVLQFGCVIVGTIIFLLLHLIYRGPINQAVNLPHHYSFWDNPHLIGTFLTTFFWGIWPTILIMPPIIQRVLLFRSRNTIKSTFFGASTTYMAFASIMIFIGISMSSRNFFLVRKLRIDTLMNMACTNNIGKCIFLLVLVSITMSTMDSFINSSAIDSVYLLQKIGIFNADKFSKNNRLATVMVGFIATIGAVVICQYNIVHVEIFGYALIISSLLVTPFVFGLFLKGDKRIFFITILSSFAIYCLAIVVLNTSSVVGVIGTAYRSSNFFQTARVAWFISIITSVVVYFCSHYVIFRNLFWVDESGRVQGYNTFIDVTWLTDPITWANKKALAYGTDAYLLAVFLCINFFVPYVSNNASLDTMVLVICMRTLGIVLITLLLIESIWRKKYLKYFNLFYYATIFFCVPFSSIMIVWQDPQSGIATSLIFQEIVLLILLVDWQTFFLFNIVSIGFAMFFQKIWHDYYYPSFGSDSFILLANIIYSLAVCLTFARKKQIKYYIEKYNLTKKNKDTTNQLQVQQEAHQQLASSLDSGSSMITEMTKAIGVLEAEGSNQQQLQKLKSAIAHLTMVKDKSLEYLPLKSTKTSLKALVQNVGTELKATGWAEKVDLLLQLQDVGDEDEIRADMPCLQLLLFNSVKYQCKYYQATQVRCIITPATINYSEGDITNEKKGYQFIISIDKMQPTKKVYHISQGLPLLPTDKAYLHTNLHITTSHFGIMEVKESTNKCILTYVLPCDVKEVKAIMGRFVDEDLSKVTQITDEADIAFLELADSKGLNKDLMERALRTCKHYHRHQKRHSGELFYLHPLAVTTMLLDHTTDPAVIVAGLLHDTIEDTPYTAHQMTAEFGAEVTKIVRDITNLYDQASRKVKLAKQDVFAGLLEKENKKALLVKLLDRVHNIETIEGHPSIEKRKKVASETLKFFVPVARRLGKKKIGEDFETVCQRIISF